MKSKILIVVLVILLGVLVLALGFYLGKRQGEQAATNQNAKTLEPLVNMAFPKPADVLYSLNGAVIGIYGGTINMQVKDPSDYLPHLDSTPQKTQIRYANLTSATKIFTTDYAKRDANGNPLQLPLKSTDIKVGDTIKVTSASNIRDAQKFDVTEVEVLK